jgi:hypothetical protein
MAATYPSREPDRSEGSTRPRLASAPEAPARRSSRRWIVIGLVIAAAAAVLAYFLIYGGGGSGAGGSGGSGGGGYFFLALPADGVRRLAGRVRNRLR